jgi:hypothetical protein
MTDRYRQGDHYVIDDRTGQKIYASEARKEWTGDFVHSKNWEPRQPQDLIRSRRDDQSVTNARPRPLDIFVGPLTTELTADAVAGDTSLTLMSSVRMVAADRVSVMLDNGDTFLTTIASVPDATHVVLSDPLPNAASTGKFFYDNTALAAPEIG